MKSHHARLTFVAVLGVGAGAMASCYPWGGPLLSATVVESGTYNPEDCTLTGSRAYTLKNRSGEWGMTLWFCCDRGSTKPIEEPCPGDSTLLLALTSNAIGTGAHWASSSGVSPLAHVIINSWEQPYAESLYATRLSGTITWDPYPGDTSMIEFDGALFMGPLDPCFDDPAFDTKVFHAFETDDPDIGTAAGYLCCADENECAEWVP